MPTRIFWLQPASNRAGTTGPKWNDGDFYKWLEAVAFVYATTRDEDLNRQMDGIIEVIGKAQREDGYLHTPVIIAQRQNLPGADGFEDRLDFETYNMGHLMTCACVHYRATGKTSLLDDREEGHGLPLPNLQEVAPTRWRTTPSVPRTTWASWRCTVRPAIPGTWNWPVV